MCFAPQRRALFRHLNFQKWSEPLVLLTCWLRNVLRATTACTFSTSRRRSGRLRCRARSGSTGFRRRFWRRSGRLWCRAKSGSAGFRRKFRRFWLGNVLRATAACTFLTSQLPKVFRDPGVLYLSLQNLLRATTACNFSFLISPHVSVPAALASLLFDPPEPQNIEKTECFATFLPFRTPASSFFWSFLFWLFSPLTLLPSGSSHLCFFICPYCQKLNFQTCFDNLY